MIEEVVVNHAIAALKHQQGTENAGCGAYDLPGDLLDIIIWPIYQVEGGHHEAHATQQHQRDAHILPFFNLGFTSLQWSFVETCQQFKCQDIQEQGSGLLEEVASNPPSFKTHHMTPKFFKSLLEGALLSNPMPPDSRPLLFLGK